MNEQICKHCEHWEAKDPQADAGRCTGKIPNSTLVMQQGLGGQAAPVVITFWPETRPTDRCGEWEQGFIGEDTATPLKLA